MKHIPHPLIYLTGIPASGKSTLVRKLKAAVPRAIVLEYSALLCAHISQRLEREVNHSELRKASSVLITRDDVAMLDASLLAQCKKLRRNQPIVLVSHAVTAESYGFRMIPFSPAQLREIRPTAICMLMCPPTTVAKRISADPQGRPPATAYKTSIHFEIQASLAAAYGFELGVPTYYLEHDRSSGPALEVISRLLVPR